MLLTDTFRRLILRRIENMFPEAKVGRKRSITNTEAIDHIFRVCRTGSSWRDSNSPVSYVTLFRRFHAWSAGGVFKDAYKEILKMYLKRNPTKHILHMFFLARLLPHAHWRPGPIICGGRRTRGRKSVAYASSVSSRGLGASSRGVEAST